jgi:uncharacterized protein (DUF2267 family)
LIFRPGEPWRFPLQGVYWRNIDPRRRSVDHNTFVYEVIQRAGVPGRSEAERLTYAVLTTLGERLISQERDRLAAQLPGDLKPFLVHQPPGQDYPLKQFYELVSQRADMASEQIVEQTRAVVSVLRDAVSTGEIQDVLDTLPPEFAELFGREPVEPLAPETS